MKNARKMFATTMTAAALMASALPVTAFADTATSEKPIGPGYSEAVTREYITKITDDVVMRRFNALPVDAKEEVEEAINTISDDVIDLYRNAKGKMYFRSHALQTDLSSEEPEDYTAGIYRYHNARIEILADHATLTDDSLSLVDPIYHEFGHFLYNQTWNDISDSARQEAREIYSSNPSYYGTVEEAFADAYMAFKEGTSDSSKVLIGLEAENSASVQAELEFAPPAAE